VILADCPAHALPRVAGMLQRILSAAAISWWGDHISITASIGTTAVIGGDTAETIRARAEAALEASVAEGGNRVTTI
jgi:GGDEF domain-containing protein